MADLKLRAFVGSFPSQPARRYNLQRVNLIGSSDELNVPDVYIISCCALSPTRVVVLTYPYWKLSTWDLVGCEWVRKGHYVETYSSTDGSRIYKLSSNRIVVVAPTEDVVATWEFDGTDWYQVGNTYSLAGITYPYCAVISETEIIVSATSGGDFEVLSFDGTDWNNVTTISLGLSSEAPFCEMSPTRIALLDMAKQWIVAYDYSEYTLNQVGSTLSFPVAPADQLVRIDDNRVLIASGNYHTLVLMTFNGSTWSQKIYNYDFISMDIPYLCNLSEPVADFAMLRLGFEPTGKLLEPCYPDPLNVGGIYQRRMTKQGKKSFKLVFYTPTNPQTVPQQANRAKFADAVAGWMSLTTEEKIAYNKRARKIKLFGWNLFIREYFATH